MGDLSGMTAKGIVGSIYEMLDDTMQMGWENKVGFATSSDQEQETYKFLGNAPVMREWVGGLQAKQLRDNQFIIKNKDFEATLDIHRKDRKFDKTGQIGTKIGELSDRVNSHWQKLLTSLIINGTTDLCYDGKAFFATTHTEGDSGTLSNLLTAGAGYSELDVATANNPTASELTEIVMKLIQHQYGYLDDQGEPINQSALNFCLMVPTNMWGAAQISVSKDGLHTGTGVKNNPLLGQSFNLEIIPNPRLTSDTEVYLFRTDARTGPFILQTLEQPWVESIAEGSDYTKRTNRENYIVKAGRNVGYCYWQHAIKATLS